MWLFLVFPSPSSEEPSNVLYIPCCLDMSNSFYGCQKVAFYPFQDWGRSFLPVSSGGNLSPRNKEHRDFSKKRTRNKEQAVHFLESLISLLLRQPFPTDYQFPGGFFSHNFRKTWKWGKALSLTSRLLHSPFSRYVHFQQLLILCVSVRDHRRGAGDPFSERPEPAAEDARPEQGRDRADEATVSFSFSSPPMRCTDRTVFLVTFCPFPRKVTWPVSFSWLSCKVIHTQSWIWRSNHFHTPLLFVCYGDVAVHTNPN